MPIDPTLFNPSSSSYRHRTDLDRELAEEDLMDARDLKQLRVREVKAKREARIREFEERSGIGNPGGRSNRERVDLAKALITNPQVQKEWLNMNDAARAILMASANTLTQQGQSANVLASYMPFMMMQMRQNPSTSVKEMVDLINIVRPVANTGRSETAEIIKSLALFQKQQDQGGKGGGITETLTAVLAIFDRMSQKDQQLISQQLKHLEGQIINPVEWMKAMQENMDLFDRGTPNLEIEKLKTNTKLQLQKMFMDQEQWRDKAGLDRIEAKGRQAMLAQVFDRGFQTAQPLINRFAAGGGVKQINPPKKTGNALACTDCGFMIPVSGSPESVKCPNCGLVHKRQALDEPPAQPRKQTETSTFTMEKK